MKLLITGSAGFIGSHLVDIALAKGYDVTAVDGMLEGSQSQNIRSDVDFKQIKVEKLTKYHLKDWNIDAIINVAALSNVDSSIKTPRAFESNVTSASNMAFLASELNIPLVHCSTDEEYGPYNLNKEFPFGFCWDRNEQKGYNEQQSIEPTSAYAASKAAATQMVLSYYRTYGTRIMVSRGANTYGTRQIDKLIPTICKKVKEDLPIPIFKTPALREWLHVYDHCEALLTILEKGKAGEIYNVGSGQQRSPQQIASLLKPDHPIELIEDRKGYDLEYRLDASKIKRELGWSPRYDVDTEVPKLLDWYLENG